MLRVTYLVSRKLLAEVVTADVVENLFVKNATDPQPLSNQAFGADPVLVEVTIPENVDIVIQYAPEFADVQPTEYPKESI